MVACLTSWTSSGFFLEIICVGKNEEKRTQSPSYSSYAMVGVWCQCWFMNSLWGWHKYEQGHSSVCDNESIIQWMTKVLTLECRNETSPATISSRMAGRERKKQPGLIIIELGACQCLCKITAQTGNWRPGVFFITRGLTSLHKHLIWEFWIIINGDRSPFLQRQ